MKAACVAEPVEINEDEHRLLIEMGGAGDTVQFTKSKEGGLHIEIDEPWAGSTETGFGATTSIYLTPDVLKRLWGWMGRGGI